LQNDTIQTIVYSW